MTELHRRAWEKPGAGHIDRRSLLLAAPLALVSTSLFAQMGETSKPRLGVLYAASDRFKPIIDAALSGIESAASGWAVTQHAIHPGIGSTDINAWLGSPVDGWLLLGTEAKEAAKTHEFKVPVVTGLQYTSPQDSGSYGGVSLDFDPEAVLPELKTLLPNRDRIQVVYARGRDDWIVDRLRKSGAMRGYAVAPAGADTLGEATDHLSGILRYGNPETDIVWLPGGPDIITRDTSTHLFQQAFNARFPVFSNRRAWVEEGAFLGGEPDFSEHGAQMVRVLRRMIETGEAHYELTGRVSFALNVRVARRIGVPVTEEVRRSMGALVADD